MKPYILHREGRVEVAVIVLATLVGGGLSFWLLGNHWFAWLLTLTLAVLAGLVLNFFRNPTRTIATNDQHVIASCDGKVVVIEEVEEPKFFKGKRIQVSIFMSPLNVHVNRSPIAGEVAHFEYKPGKFLVAWDPKSSEENEQTYTVVRNGRHAIGFKQIAGAVARRIRWYIKPGDALAQGQEYGFIKFGSRMDLLLPLDAKVTVQLGQVVRGGETVVAELPQ